MKNVAAIPHWHYPTIVRVVMDVSVVHHVRIIQADEPRDGFQERELRKVFGIKEMSEWSLSRIKSWSDAREELQRLIRLRPDVEMLDEIFITLRPRHNEMVTVNETLRRARLAQAA